MLCARASANRTLALALLASLVAHVLLLVLEWPQLESDPSVEVPDPIVARLVDPPAPPPPAPVSPAPSPRPAPQREAPKPPVERPLPPRIGKPSPPRIEKPSPPRVERPREAPKEVPRAVAPAPAPAPSIAPAPSPAPAPPVSDPAPPIEAAPRSAPVAPSAENLKAQYRAALLDAARREKRYPPVAIDNGWEGEVSVRMRIGADGGIASLRVAASSGYAVLDRHALQMFRRAFARVALPETLRGQAFEIELRAVFRLEDQASG